MQIKDYRSNRRLGRDLITILSTRNKIMPYTRLHFAYYCVGSILLLGASALFFTTFHHYFRPKALWDPDHWSHIFRTLNILIIAYPGIILMSLLNRARKLSKKFADKLLTTEQLTGLDISSRLGELPQERAETALAKLGRFTYLLPRKICHINLSAVVSGLRRWHIIQEVLSIASIIAMGLGLILIGYVFSVNWHRPIRAHEMEAASSMLHSMGIYPLLGILIAFITDRFRTEDDVPNPTLKEIEETHEYYKKNKQILEGLSDVTI